MIDRLLGPGRGRDAIAHWWERCRMPSPRLSLALQGGGAHGAFTWGVLDRLLEEPRIDFDGLCGSSAGAMNAVFLAQGWMDGGREGARRALAQFWGAMGRQMPASMVTRGEDDTFSLSPGTRLFARWVGLFSPAQVNPLALNPLGDVVRAQIDFERLRTASPFKLFVGATEVSTGRLRIFRDFELTAEMLLASACLPKVHHPVEIGGQRYWDGGYSANPAVFPLIDACDSLDVLLVLLSPLKLARMPGTVAEIEERIAELAFSTHFLREMDLHARAAESAGSMWHTTGRRGRRLRSMRFHMIDSSEVTSLRRAETRWLAHTPFLEALRDDGRACATAWLEDHRGSIGHRSSHDLRQWLC